MRKLETSPWKPTSQRRLVAALSTIAAIAGGCSLASRAHAFELNTGNTDLKIRFDNQIRYAVGLRGEKINSAFGNSPTFDETEYRAGRGDVMMNRLDLLSELDAVYKGKYGFRLSGAAWRDQAYHDRMSQTNPGLLAPGLPYSAIGNYVGNEYSSTTSRFSYQGAELLDAFAFGNFQIGDTSVNVKLGKHTVYWGEALFTTFHGISYSQAPLDGLKGASSPGIEAKEVFMPVNQLSASAQLSPEWSLRGQYFLAWRPNRLPQGGTYFGAADMLFDGPDRIFAGQAGLVPRGDSVQPSRNHTDNFGVNLRYSPQAMDGTTFGLFYRQFDETQPWAPVFRLSPTSPVPLDYHLAYAKNTQMFAGSMQTSAGPVSVGAELSYRKDTALNSNSAFVSSTGSVLNFNGTEGARGDTLHAVLNGVYLLPRTPLWETGTLLGELVYSHLMRVTKNADLFNGVGYLGCNAGVTSATGGAKRIGDKGDGCATRNVFLMQIGLTPQWLQVFPGVDLSAPMSIAYGLSGNGATLGGGNEGALSYSVGLEFDMRQQYKFGIKWSDQRARYNTGANGLATTSSGNAVQNDHGWLAVTFKASF